MIRNNIQFNFQKVSTELIRFFFLSVLFAIDMQRAMAEPSIADLPTEPAVELQRPSQLAEDFMSSNAAIAEWFDSVAEGIDLFLVNKKVSEEQNETMVRLANLTSSSEGVPVRNEWILQVIPRFPNLEKYWSLKFSSYDEQEERGVDKNYLRQSVRDRNYGASVGLFRRVGPVRLQFQPRIELQDPLQVSHSIAIETVLLLPKLGSGLKVNPKLEFFAHARRGPGVFNALNFSYSIDEITELTQINEAEYHDRRRLLAVTNGLSLGRIINSQNTLTYSLLFFSSSRENYHLTGYNLAVGWYHLIYKKVLDFSLTPNLDFSENLDFKGRAGVTLQVTVHF